MPLLKKYVGERIGGYGDNYHGVKNFTKEQITYTIEELIEEELMQGITLGFKERMRFAEGNDEGGK